ncbi:hypothetical protein F5Y03DRAFT_378314 [Xylaria venustula]|nr:hypothetical protein F5Y03DRAFT_378314 [Xylaria venustula]
MWSSGHGKCRQPWTCSPSSLRALFCFIPEVFGFGCRSRVAVSIVQSTQTAGALLVRFLGLHAAHQQRTRSDHGGGDTLSPRASHATTTLARSPA